MSRKIRIGILLPAIPGYSETFIKTKILGLIACGYNVSLFINNNKSTNIEIPLSVYTQVNTSKTFCLPFILLSIFITTPLRICRFIKLERISGYNWVTVMKHVIINAHIINKYLDWIHFEFATMGINRENLAKAIGAKSAISFRGYDISLFPHKHKGCYKLLWNTIDKVHTISDDLYSNALNQGLSPQILMTKIRPAIEIEKFTMSEISDIHDPVRMLSVGRLVWKKGFEYALNALKLLKERNVNFEYRIIGEGNYRESIIYTIEKLELNNEVSLIGAISHKEVKNNMEWADIYLQPSIQEGFCNAVLEAQSMGLLCIVTNAEGLSENVLHGKTGWVVKKRSAKSIFNKIMEILSMQFIERKQIIENATKRTRQEFDIKSQIDYWDDFYQEK